MYSAILAMLICTQPVIFDDGPKKMPKCTCMNDGSPCICAPGRCSCEVGDYTKPTNDKPAVVFVGMKPRHVEGFIVQKSNAFYWFGLNGPGIVVWDGKQRIDLPPNASNADIKRAVTQPRQSFQEQPQYYQPAMRSGGRGGC